MLFLFHVIWILSSPLFDWQEKEAWEGRARHWCVGTAQECPSKRIRENRLWVWHHRPEGHAEASEKDEGRAQAQRGWEGSSTKSKGALIKGTNYRKSVNFTAGERWKEGMKVVVSEVMCSYVCPFLPVIAAFLKRLESCYSVEKGKKIVLRCEVVDPNIQVKWLKNGQEVKPSAKYVIKHTHTPTHTHMHTIVCCVLRAYNPAAISYKILCLDRLVVKL